MSSFKFNLTDYNAGRRFEKLLLPYVCECIGDVELSPERSRYDFYNPSLWAELKTRTPRYSSDMDKWLFNSKKANGYVASKKLFFFYYFIKDCSFYMIEYNPSKFAEFEKWEMLDEDGEIQTNWLIPRKCWTRICTELEGDLVSNPIALRVSDKHKKQVPETSALSL
jgi:hypothetical protein